MSVWPFGRAERSGESSSSQTCPECGSQLLPRRDELHESQTAAQGVPEIGDSCDSSLRPGDLACPNPDCPAQVRRVLLHWCSPEVMDIPGGNEQVIALLVQHGLVQDVAELYRLKVKELAALPGMTEASAQMFFDAITASLKRDGWRLLVGLNIPSVGVAEALALARGFSTVDAVFAAGAPRLVKEGGVSETVARSLVQWFSDGVNRRLVKRLEKFGLNFKSVCPPE